MKNVFNSLKIACMHNLLNYALSFLTTVTITTIILSEHKHVEYYERYRVGKI